MTYLIEADTDPSKSVLIGVGERPPITGNEAEDGRAENRRGDVLEHPVNLGELNLINRLIIPYLGVDANLSRLDLGKGEVPPSDVDRNGFGNIQYQAFFTPAKPGKIIWGAGPVLEVPSHTNDLGSSKWSAGPAAVVLAMPGDWVLARWRRISGPLPARATPRVSTSSSFNISSTTTFPTAGI